VVNNEDKYKEYGGKDKISGTNEMNKRKKSLVSKMFGGGGGSSIRKNVPVPAEDNSEVFVEEV
jgi:hypothetical protein